MGQLEDMQMFLRIVDAGGIGKAAEQMGIAKSAVSRRLSELEERLGNRLINRTTRQFSLSDSGRLLYQRAQTVVDYVDEIHSDLSSADMAASGRLRIALPLSFALMHLTRVIDEFMDLHPLVTVQLDFSDRLVDMVEEGFDLALRIADLKDSTAQARRIAPVKVIMVASPQYLASQGVPTNIEQLKQHTILKYEGASTSASSWQMTDPEGQQVSVSLEPKMSANNGDFLKAMALAHKGITMLPTFLAWKELATGELVEVLGDHRVPELSAYAIYPRNRYLPKRARLLIDFIAQKFGENPYWDQG